MGLEEKRAIKTAQDGWLPAKTKELAELSGGGGMTYEIDWASFEGDVKGIEWLEFNGPQQVSNAFRQVGKDDVGKEALREAVKKVVIRNTKDEKDKTLSFEGGALTLVCAFAKSPGGRFKDSEIRDLLLKNL